MTPRWNFRSISLHMNQTLVRTKLRSDRYGAFLTMWTLWIMETMAAIYSICLITSVLLDFQDDRQYHT